MSRIVYVITRFVNDGADENALLACNHQAWTGHRVWLFHGSDFTECMVALPEPRVEAAASVVWSGKWGSPGTPARH